MRQRALTAAVLVPVLLIVLWLGGIVLAAAIALVTVIAAREVFALLTGSGHADVPVAGHGPGPDRHPGFGVPRRPGGQRPAARGRRHRPRRGGRVLEAGSAGRPDELDRARCSARCTSACSRSSSASAMSPRPSRPPRRSTFVGAETRLDPAAHPRGLVVRHRCVPRRQAVRDGQVPDPHLAVQDVCRPDRWGGGDDHRRRPSCCSGSASRRSTRCCSGRSSR